MGAKPLAETAGGRAAGFRTLKGAVRVKVVPAPGSLSTLIPPSMQPARRLQMARPIPVPPKRRVVDWSAWEKASKIVARFSSGMPMPVSRTAKARAAMSPVLRGGVVDRDGDFDAALFGELEGVVDQVGEYLVEADGICGNRLGHVWRDVTCQIKALAQGALGKELKGVVKQRARVNGNALQFEAAGFDLGEVEDVVDDREQALAGFNDDVGVALEAW